MTPLLLHACCAPCSLEPVRLLVEEGFAPTICWTNPNIQPVAEHDRRLEELRRWTADMHLPLIEAGDDRARWDAAVAPLGADRERRCRACYALRLAEACRVAEREGIGHIATTLAVSPYQLLDTCNDVLGEARGGPRPHARRARFSPVVSAGHAALARAGYVSSELLRLPLLRGGGGARPRSIARGAQGGKKRPPASRRHSLHRAALSWTAVLR